MALDKLKFRSGINREGTFYSNTGGYFNCNRVRFRSGYPEVIGGWQKQTSNTFVGTARNLIYWTDLSGENLYGVGTNVKYYLQRGGAYFDKTPIRRSVTLGANPFATTSGLSTVTVTDVAHGATNGDYVTFSGGSAVAGLDLNAEYVISNVSADSYTITASGTAGSTTTGGGAAVVAAYQINVGLDTVTLGSGWGSSEWGGGGWGSGGTVLLSNGQLRLWSHDNFGEDLIINPRDGAIYYDDRTLGNTARAVELGTLSGATDTPVVATQILVSEADRHVLAFGANPIGSSVQDRLLIRWSDQEDVANWTVTATTTAGDLRIPIGSQIMKAVRTRQEILVFTDISLHSVQFIGPPYTFGQQLLSGNISVAGPEAVCVSGDLVFWMGNENFYVYSGRVEPIPCTLLDYVFRDINLDQRYKIVSGTNKQFNEVWWFYPSASSDENDRYIAFNYVTNEWHYGSLARTAWLDVKVTEPIAAGTDGYLYVHEYGIDDGSENPPVSLNAFIESSPLEIGNGDHFLFISRLIPDISYDGSTATSPTISFTMTGYQYPGGSYRPNESGNVIRIVDTDLDQFTQKIDTRLRARAVSIRYASDVAGTRWRVGEMRIDARPDGRR